MLFRGRTGAWRSPKRKDIGSLARKREWLMDFSCCGLFARLRIRSCHGVAPFWSLHINRLYAWIRRKALSTQYSFLLKDIHARGEAH
jgi:hypothetical protein